MKPEALWLFHLLSLLLLLLFSSSSSTATPLTRPPTTWTPCSALRRRPRPPRPPRPPSPGRTAPPRRRCAPTAAGGLRCDQSGGAMNRGARVLPSSPSFTSFLLFCPSFLFSGGTPRPSSLVAPKDHGGLIGGYARPPPLG